MVAIFGNIMEDNAEKVLLSNEIEMTKVFADDVYVLSN
jgi:hypothetical protein